MNSMEICDRLLDFCLLYLRLMMMPKKWYAQRTRSESHASSDMEQYQDASEYLDLDTHIGHLSSSPNSKPNLPSATEYLNLDSGSSSISTHVPAHISNPGPSHTITILTTKDVVNLLEFPSAPDTESTSQDDVERILDSSDQRIEGSEDGPNVTSEEVELEKQAEKKEGEDNSEGKQMRPFLHAFKFEIISNFTE